MKVTLTFELPDSVKLTDKELKMILAAKLFDLGELSSGQAAIIAEISRREFIETVGKYGVSIFQYTAEKAMEDFARLQS